jgi:nucleotide-binding universal stress UspA family protein
LYQAQKQLDYLVGEVVPSVALSQTLVRQSHDRPANEIIQAANELDADLIIISTHGRTGLKRFVFGSTAEYVVRRASCPVLTLRTREPKQEE